jgi:GT2 family glycosyltransferase
VDRCDIVVPVWNQLGPTKDCLSSVFKNTSYPFRLIIVDNASDNAMRIYLEGLKAERDASVTLIRNERNLGFIRAVNQGIDASDANFICILNNDTIVTKSWLGEMVRVAESRQEIGIVNPSSNNLGQAPAEGEPVEIYAGRLKDESGKFSELGAAIGFCMLIKRKVIERIGLFDEIYGMGNFEDTDFSRKAVKEGFTCVRAHAAYVYHKESTSFGKVKTFEDDFNRNKEIYEFRWGAPKRIAYVLDSADPALLKRLGSEALKLARQGNWVRYYCNTEVAVPGHSNIILENMKKEKFYLNVLIKVLVKKKKFDEIMVGDGRFGRVLEKLAFLHKAKIGYY